MAARRPRALFRDKRWSERNDNRRAPLQNATTGSYAGMLASRAVRITLSTAKKTIVKMVTNAMLW